MKLIFTPFSIVVSLLAGKLSKKLFDLVWGRIDDSEAPHPKHRGIDVRKLAVSLVLEGALLRLIKGLVDHASRRGFHRATGSWPGEERPEAA